MTASHICPQCGNTLSSDAPQGLCPDCLLKAALPGQTNLESAMTAAYSSSSSSAIAIAPEAGVRLKYFGDYELLEEIARGGMGVVWKARQSSLKRDVALKMIRAGALATRDEVERFLREAEAAANLQHPNIVAIHEVGEHGGQHYFSMDYVDGRDLGALVKDGPLSPKRAATYVKIIAEAIHFAHQRGTLHRDLKPQNVLIDAADRPRITDFGLAKIMMDDSRLTQSGVVMGSPSYMPPEQAAGRQADIGPASDVYSLGAMLYELLTAQPPFRGATPMATMREVMEAEPTAPRKLNASIPLDLETICLKCLEKTPSRRYPTARVLAEELDRFLKGEPIQARPASLLRKTVIWGRQHPGVLAALLALIVVTLAFGVFYLFEENAFLRAQQANPSLTRRRGPLHESLQNWSTIGSLAMAIGIFSLIAVRGRTRRLSVKHWLSPGLYAQPPQPLDRPTRLFAIGAGLVAVGCGVVLLVKTTQAHVWEGEPIRGQIAEIYCSIYWGLAILAIVIQDYRLVHYGMASRRLTAQQIEPIRLAMENWNVAAAIDLYRRAVPDAGAMEASQYVIRLAKTLRAQNPGKFVPPPLSLATLNWNAMLLCALIQAIILANVWYIARPAHPAFAIAHFTCGFLLGAGVIAGLRVKGLWKRLLLLTPALLVMILGEVIVPRLGGTSSHLIGPYFFGIFFGAFLMIFGFTQRHEGRSIAVELEAGQR